ncbi:MAG: hypothetical protein M1828_007154 [Chrysothrix sp. TS-e1954]|nr:MAG: hypothetical protein M1828_007154 [Chrysothrix sp. TS-e1954]
MATAPHQANSPPPTPIHLTTLTLAHTNPTTSTLHIALFHSVSATTITHLRTRLLASDPTYNYALLDASLLISRTHLLAACFRAVHAAETGKLRSRNVHSEIVLSLSPGNNIRSALGVFGIKEGMQGGLCVVKVGEPGLREEVEKFLGSVVEGRSVVFGEEGVRMGTDWEQVGRVYKLSGVVPEKVLKGDKKGGEADGEEEEGGPQWRKDAEVLAMGMMALRGS